MSLTTTPDRALPIARMAAMCGSCGEALTPCRVCGEGELICACSSRFVEVENDVHIRCVGIYISRLEARIRDLERYKKLGHDVEMAIQRRTGKRLVPTP